MIQATFASIFLGMSIGFCFMCCVFARRHDRVGAVTALVLMVLTAASTVYLWDNPL